jgi:hypothetical protein
VDGFGFITLGHRCGKLRVLMNQHPMASTRPIFFQKISTVSFQRRLSPVQIELYTMH